MKPEFLRECFTYHEDGYLIWNHRPLKHFRSQYGFNTFNSRFAGQKAGYLSNSGYMVVEIVCDDIKTQLLVHRVIWMIANGELADDVKLDHDDTNTLNNKIGNLRLATSSENNMNHSMRSDNTSGIKGVYKQGNRWIASIGKGGKRFYLGSFITKEEASDALVKERPQLHKEFTNFGVK